MNCISNHFAYHKFLAAISDSVENTIDEVIDGDVYWEVYSVIGDAGELPVGPAVTASMYRQVPAVHEAIWANLYHTVYSAMYSSVDIELPIEWVAERRALEIFENGV